MPDFVAPHFQVPFSLTGDGGHAQCVEQDSQEDIFQCVQAVVATRQGFRLELPEFGIGEPLFKEGGPDTTAIARAIETWEPRADLVIDMTSDAEMERLAYFVSIGVEG